MRGIPNRGCPILGETAQRKKSQQEEEWSDTHIANLSDEVTRSTMRFLLPLLFTLFGWTANSQTILPLESPAQSFAITARLDPATAKLDASWRLHFRNDSRRILDTLVFHIWADAFRFPNSSYGQQKLIMGETDFYFLPPDQRNGYTSLHFQRGSDSLSYRIDPAQPDVLYLALPQALRPGDTITLQATYQLALPGFQSRLGTDGQIWQLAHWFPKPARIERMEWFIRPYLELGEWAQDFATYDVQLTVPDSFVVVGTGQPADTPTRSHRQAALEHTRAGLAGLPPSDTGWRTWHFRADWVPDMALALSPDYFLEAREITLRDGLTTTGQVAYTGEHSNWTEALDYVERGTQYYDRHVGPYPWPTVSAVQGVADFEGGMEYPMLTYIQPQIPAAALDQVIAHEIGHNWFYGILSSDERTSPWLDEGLNSYYEERYTDAWIDNPLDFLGLDPVDFLLRGRAAQNRLPIPVDGVQHLRSGIDYQLGSYTIPARLFKLLEHLTDTIAIDQAFQAYYQAHRFTHPQPADFQRTFSAALPIQTNWLFDQGLRLPFQRDLRVRVAKKEGRSGEQQVTIHQRGTPGLPWSLTTHSAAGQVQTTWHPGFSGTDTTLVLAHDSIHHLTVDHALVPDLRPGNNTWWTGWPHRHREWRPGFLAGIREPEKSRTYLVPLLGHNAPDGTQLGLLAHNQKIYYRRTGYAVGALYGLTSQRWNATAAFHHDIYPGRKPSFFRLGLRTKTFSYQTSSTLDRTFAYWRWHPFLEWRSSAQPENQTLHGQIGLHAWLVQREVPGFTPGGEFRGVDRNWDRIFALRSTLQRKDALYPWLVHLDLEGQPYQDPFGENQFYLRLGLESRTGWTFMHRRRISIRGFLGYFLANTRRDAGSVSNPATRGSFALAFQGRNDYRYEQTFGGRTETDGFWSHQVAIREGGFKVPLGPTFQDGQSNDQIAALNLVSDLPIPGSFRIPLQVYADMGWWEDATPLGSTRRESEQLWIDVGVALPIWRDRIMIYCSLWQNEHLSDLTRQRGDGLAPRISWMARFDLAQLPWDVFGSL